MEKFQKLTTIAAPFPLKDVDTDLIIPAQFLTSTSKSGYGEHLFSRLRASDQNFFMNDKRYQDSQVVICGDNFGCGSSREHAVWALMGAGFKALIGTDFADIFSGNSAKNGLLLISLSAQERDALVKAASSGELRVTIDLQEQSVSSSDGNTYKFKYDSFRKSCLLNGFDDLDYLLSHKDEIARYFSEKR